MALEDQFKQEDVEEIEQRHAVIMAEHERFNSHRKAWGWVEETDDWFGFSDDSGAGLF